MTPVWLLVIAVARALAWLTMPPATLGMAAEREALRRQVVGPAVGSYNNDNLASAMFITPPRIEAAPAAPSSSSRDIEPRDETWWRLRLADMRSAIERGGRESVALESEIARLDLQAVTRDDPAQQSALRTQAADARAELEKRRVNVASARRDLEELLEQARRANVPPGWLR